MSVCGYDPDRHIYTIDGQRAVSVTEPLSGLGLYRGSEFFTNEARDRGTRLHRAVALWLDENLDENTVDDDIRPRLEGVKRFFLTVLATGEINFEKPRFNAPLLLAGTPDWDGELLGDDAIVDYKSGGVDPVVALQLAGYDILLGGPRRKRYALQVRPDGLYKLHPFTDTRDYPRFLAALDLYRTFKEGRSSRVAA